MRDLKKSVFSMLDALVSKGIIDKGMTNKEIYKKGHFDVAFPKDPKTTVKRYFTEWRAITEDTGHNVLVIGDLHAPFNHRLTMHYINSVLERNRIDEIVLLGDIIDNHYLSFHDKDPDGYGSNLEFLKAKGFLDGLHKLIPKCKVCIGNHDALADRKAFKAGMSRRWIRTIPEVFDLPGWDFQDFHRIGDFVFTHGLGQQANSRSEDLGLSVVQGHYHSKFDVEAIYDQNVQGNVRYAVNGGCLIDSDAYAFAYGKFGRINRMGLTIIEDILGKPIVKQIKIENDNK